MDIFKTDKLIILNLCKKISSKLVILFIIILIYFPDPFYIDKLENKIIRYIKYNRNKRLLFYNFEKHLPNIRNYIKILIAMYSEY